MKGRVDPKIMGNEHDDGNNQREEAKDTVSRDELVPPIGEAGKEEATDSEEDRALAVPESLLLVRRATDENKQ
jgi:hypothetical protein